MLSLRGASVVVVVNLSVVNALSYVCQVVVVNVCTFCTVSQ